MEAMDSFLVNIKSAYINSNVVKEVVLNQLLNDEAITDEQHAEYYADWHIIILKKSWLKKWSDRVLKGDKDTYIYQYVKLSGGD